MGKLTLTTAETDGYLNVLKSATSSYATGNLILNGIMFTADGESYVTGQALSEELPASPFTDAKHFYEIGHVIEARTGAGLASVILHFN